MMITQYYSKWRRKWCLFKDSFGSPYTPNESEIQEMIKFGYKLK